MVIEIFKSRSVQAYLIFTSGIWIVALGLIVNGGNSPSNPVWGFISSLRWILLAPFVLAALVWVFIGNKSKQPDSQSRKIKSEVPLIKLTPEILSEELPKPAVIAPLIVVTPEATPKPEVQVTKAKTIESAEEAVASALEEFL